MKGTGIIPCGISNAEVSVQAADVSRLNPKDRMIFILHANAMKRDSGVYN